MRDTMRVRAVGPRLPAEVALIDIDSGFVRVLAKRLEAAGWRYRVLSGAPAVEALVEMRLSAMVIDAALAGDSAWSYLEAVSERLPHLGILVCTAPAPLDRRVRGLRLGADDWVTKPAHPEELLARLEAVVRRRKRARAPAPTGPVSIGGLEIDANRFQVFAGGVSAGLTRKEFELLELLAAAPGQVLEREDIYERVWGYAMARGDRSVDVFVRKLRLKLARVAPGRPFIHTHFGIGYRFAPEHADPVTVEHPAAVEVMAV